jgi:ATP/ADP translocase/HEAT repeat protein
MPARSGARACRYEVRVLTLGQFGRIRASERRAVIAALATLLTSMAGHALLETARDALFLASVPAAQLPWVYFAIAAGSLVVTWLAERRGVRTTAYQLSAWLLFSAVSIVALKLVIVDAGSAALYALYVWSGVIATVIVTRFWLLLGEHFTLTEAKRLYGMIGAGGVLGAIAGSGLARVLTMHMAPQALLSAAAALFVLSAAGPLLMQSVAQRKAVAPREREPLDLKMLFESGYASRVGVLILCSAVALTLADFLFKSRVSAAVPTHELGSFFASVYLGLNVLSLIVQLAVVPPLVRALGVSGTLTVLPALILGSAAGMLVSGGLLVALLLKSADGALRHSLHRTVTELLFVPMGERLRSSARTFLDVIAQRGGQAVASLTILGGLALGTPNEFFVSVLMLVAALWIFTAYDLREHYLNLFRQTLRESAAHPHTRFPGLDLGSLESVIAALNSTNDAEVRAALQILAGDGRTRLIPALILYHPSPEVVVEALEILDRAGRRDFVPITERLLEHGSPQVRAAVLRLRSAQHVNEAQLKRLVAGDCPVVKATALVILLRAGLAGEDEARELERIVSQGDVPEKVALAQAIAHKPAAQFEDVLMQLAADADSAVRKAALAGMSAAPSARYLPTLMRMLSQRELRGAARGTLVALGETALSFLAGALTDEQRPITQRRHIPRTLMRFGGARVAEHLLEQLLVERDGVVRYKILRALTQMKREDQSLTLDFRKLDDALESIIRRTYQLIEWRFVLTQGAASTPERRTEAHALLVRLLYDKEIHAIERIFLLLSLRFPAEDIATVFRATSSANATVRSSSRELLENLLEPPRREAVLGLVDEAPERERLAQAGVYRTPAVDYEGVLQALLDKPSPAVRSLAVYHAAELGMSRLRPRIERLTEPEHGLLSSVARTAIEWLSELGRREVPVGS